MSDNFSSKLGFLLAAAGSSIGLGSIWRFPYMVSENGYGAFIILYIFSVLLIGIPLVLAEYVIGKEASNKTRCLGIVSIWKAHSSSGGYLLSYIFVLASWIIYTYYIVICGWILVYFFKTLMGSINYSISDISYYQGILDGILNNNFEVISATILAYIFTVLIGIIGISKGIQRLTSIGMPILFIILLIIVVRVLTLNGALEAVKSYLGFQSSDFNLKHILAAVGQAFYGLSIGLGILSTYASYAQKDNNLLNTASNTAFIISFVSFVAGLMIIPALFMFGFSNVGGPGLIFVSLPAVFSQMYGGVVLAILFFGLVIIAAITSGVALLEVIIPVIMNILKISRVKSIIIIVSFSSIISLFQILSFNVLSNVKIFGKNIFDFSDFLASRILLPLAAIITCIYLGFVINKYVVNILKSYEYRSYIVKFKIYEGWFFWVKYVIPIIITVMLLASFF